MKSLYPLHGIVTVINTPFTPQNTVDLQSLKSNLQSALDAGVNGFLVNAMASEVYKLSQKEKLNILETTLNVVENKVPVFAGLGERDVNHSRKLLKAYIERGCKNILFQIPYENEQRFELHFMNMVELEPEVIMLQDWDSSGYGLPDSLILSLFEKVEAFRCLKIEVIPAGPKYSKILKLTNGRLNISGGWAVTQMIEGLHRGVHAFMPTGMHYIYTQIYKEYISGNHLKAKILFKKILPVLSFSNQHLDISIHFFKQLLYKQRIYKTNNVRQPILPFDEIHDFFAQEHIEYIIELEKQIKRER